MSDKPRIPPPFDEERLEEAIAYYGGDLSPEEKALFEAHLADCPGCQEALRLAKENLPQLEAMLAFKPKHTIDEQVSRFEQMMAQKRSEAEDPTQNQRLVVPAVRAQRARLWIGLVFGAAVAVLLAFLLLRSGSNANGHGEVYGPHPPTEDGG